MVVGRVVVDPDHPGEIIPVADLTFVARDLQVYTFLFRVCH